MSASGPLNATSFASATGRFAPTTGMPASSPAAKIGRYIAKSYQPLCFQSTAPAIASGSRGARATAPSIAGWSSSSIISNASAGRLPAAPIARTSLACRRWWSGLSCISPSIT